MHKALLASLLAVGALLSGCADSTGDGGSAGTATSSTLTSTGPPPKPIVYSDTLHLMAAPEMLPALPEGSSEVETGTAGDFGPGGGGGNDGPPSQWAYKVTGNSNITGGEVHVWIEIKETLFPTPPSNPSQPPCTWYIQLALGGDSEAEMHCITEPAGPIDPGTKELTFNLIGLDTELEANETIGFTFGRTVFSASQTDAVAVLSGSADHDSRILLKGLKEELPFK